MDAGPTIEQILAQLREDFPGTTVTFTPDGSGGGTAVVEPVELGRRYLPNQSWLGAQLTVGLPFADVYPFYIGGEVRRADGRPHQTPISQANTFAGRPALQVSRRTNNLVATSEAAALKFTKVLHFIREVAQ